MPADCAHTCVRYGLGDCVLEEIHIVKGGHAAADLFSAGEQSSNPNKFRGNEFTFNRKHVTHQPDIEAQIIGETAQVIRAPQEDSRGMLRFATPKLGSEEWEFLCEQPVVMGDRVIVKDVSGNTLIVTRR